jgi:hypothetical protein
MTPDEQEALLGVVAPRAATPSQQALFDYGLKRRYQAQQAAYGWPLPEDAPAEPALAEVDDGFPDPPEEWEHLASAPAPKPLPPAATLDPAEVSPSLPGTAEV